MDERWPTVVNGVPVPYERSVAELRALAGSDTPERWAAIVALGRAPGPEALQGLAELAAARDPYCRRAAIEAIGKRSDGDHLGHVVLAQMTDRNGIVVRTAVEAASNLALPGAHPRLRELLKDPEPATRAASVRALARLWTREDFEAVVALFKHDPSAEVRKSAGWTLRATASADHADALFELWRSDPMPRHRQWACELAAMFPAPHLHDVLVELESDVDGHVRKAARRALQGNG